MSRTDFSFAQRGHTVTTKGPEPGPILLTKLQPDIRILASHHHHHHHYHLPTTPPLPPFSLPPSSLPPPLFLSTAVNPTAQRQGQTPPLISLPGLSLLPWLVGARTASPRHPTSDWRSPKKGRVSTLSQHPSQVQRKPLPQLE